MPLPTVQETWTISANNRITYTSLNQVMSEFLYGVKVFLKANGYTVKGSCNGVTGAMDGVDRWASAANCTTRGATAAAAQSWIVLTDGQAVDIMFAYQGATDDVCRISFSDGGLFVAAGTPSNQPTATDEAVMASATSIITTTLANDRVWHGWVNSDAKMFRILTCRSNNLQALFGVEKFIPLYDSTLSVGKAFGHLAIGTAVSMAVASSLLDVGGATNSRGGYIRYKSSATNILCGSCLEISAGTNLSVTFGAQNPAAQGGTTNIISGMYISSDVSPLRGIIGKRIDWWAAYTNNNANLGDFFGSNEFLIFSTNVTTATGGIFWPWNGGSFAAT